MKIREMNHICGGGALLSTPDYISGKFKKVKNRHFGFTLAEMMVVMLILSIVLAAMAPVMTTRNRTDQSTPWHYAENGIDAYFGLGSSQVAMLGQPEKLESDDNARLIINSTSSLPVHLSFKDDGTTIGRLQFSSPDSELGHYNIILGDGSDDGERSIAIGIGALKNNTCANNVAIGNRALQENSACNESETTGGGYGNVAIGYGVLRNTEDSFRNIGIGQNVMGNSTNKIDDNVGVGVASLYYNSGERNVAVGNFALNQNTTGGYNVAVGYEAMSRNGEASNSTAVGYQAMYSNCCGRYNVALGSQALYRNKDGYANVALGYQALYNTNKPCYGSTNPGNTEASYNTATGYQALYTNSRGSYNTATGYQALYKNTGSRNTAVGYNALKGHYSDNLTGTQNVAVGASALYYNSSGSDNIAVGNAALNQNTTGKQNIAIGSNALYSTTTGEQNIAIGTQAMGYSAGTGVQNIAIGTQAMGWNDTGTNNIALGFSALAGNNKGNNNIAMGFVTMGANTEGFNNVGIGLSALNKNTTGNNNVALGAAALTDNTTGIFNVAVGSGSLSNNTIGEYNVAVGYNSLMSNISGADNVAVGRYNLNSNTTGSKNVAIGYNPLSRNTTGGFNVAIGNDSTLASNISGSYNTAIGSGACSGFTGSNKTCIGKNSGNTIPSGSNYDTNNAEAVFIGSDDALVYIAGDLTVFGTLTGTVTAPSDRRLKYVGTEFTSGLDKIRELKVFNYTFKKDEKKIPHVGVIAQDLKKIFPDAVKKGVDGFLTIRLEDMFYAMINAIKELDAKYQAQEKRINELEKRIQKLEAKIK